MTYNFKSCCDSSFTFTLTDYTSSLVLGDVWYVIVPNYFSGCSTVVDYLYPESPTYSYLSPGVALTGSYNNCGECTSAYTCNRITGTNECEIVTIYPMGISCVPNLTGNSISIIVSGGTPPYRILWSSGTLGPTLVSPKPNEPYTVTVTDYNWPNGGPDYTATTTCSLIVPDPSPSPTPTPTPTPIPVVYPNLCIQYNDTKNTTLYTFVSTGNIINGKPTWSSGSLILKWGGLSQPYWFVSIGGVLLQNTNTNTPPIGSWTLVGGPGSAISYTGSCVQPRMSLGLATVSPPICVNTSTGSLIVNAVNAQQPVLYSINGGVTTQTSPTFNPLAAGTYNIWVQDSNSVTLTQSVTIPAGPALTSYGIVMVTSEQTISATQKKLTFRVYVTNSTTNQTITTLPPGTVLTFNIEQQNDFKVAASNPSFGEQLHTVVVTKNGVNIGITPTTSSLTQTVLSSTAGCTNITEYSTATTLTYGGITITGSDVISGTVTTTLSKKNNSVCYVKSEDKLRVTNVSNAGCSCCNSSSRYISPPMTINITGNGGINVSSFTIIKGGNINCQGNSGYYFLPNVVSQTVYAAAGLTPLTATVLYSDSALTQPIQTPGPFGAFYFAYNSQIIRVESNGVYVNQDISLGDNC